MGCFYIEALGFGRGLGVLDLNASKLALHMQLLDPARLSSAKRGRVLTAFAPLLKRDILSFDKELERRDRLDFVDTVLDAFGLTGLRSKITDSVVRLQSIRLASCEGQRAFDPTDNQDE